LFLIARYREELARGRSGEDALAVAIRKVGGALVASAGTVICGLGMLWLSSFAKIRYTGPTIAVSLAVALLASLTLAPVLLHWLRGAVFWPFKPPHHVEGRDPEAESLEETPMAGFWAKVADWIVKYPGWIFATSLLVLVPFAIVGARTQSSYSQLADLSPGSPSVRGESVVRRYFAIGELGPTSVLIQHPTLSFKSREGRVVVEDLSKRIVKIPNVAEVRSLTRPLGMPLDSPEPLGKRKPSAANSGFLDRFLGSRARSVMESPIALQGVRALSEGRYVSVSSDVAAADQAHITRIDIVYSVDPFSPKSLRTLDQVQKLVQEAGTEGKPLAGATVGYTGSTVMVDDLRAVTTRDEHLMYVLVTLGVYVILVALLRKPGISLYLIATVILGYLASLGITELFFRSLAAPGTWSGLDWKVAFFLFVILVAVGEDYNIFLMSRVVEEEARFGTIEGTRRAVAHTGGIISSCGLIMAGTFCSMLTASLTALRELGFALGLGVLLDTFVVRPILVPSFVILWHRFRGEKTGAKHSAFVPAVSEIDPLGDELDGHAESVNGNGHLDGFARPWTKVNR
jgi:putative drug exporter of the RND superfamily